MVTPRKIAVVAQHPPYVDALANLFRETWLDVEVLAVPSGAHPTFADGHACNLIVADLETLNVPGAPSLKQLVEAASPAPVVVVAQQVSKQHVLCAIADGVRAYLPKTLPSGAIRDAVSVVLAGGVCFPAQAFTEAVRGDHRFLSAQLQSRRELDVLRQLNRGWSNKMIARELGVSVAMVKLHVQAILRATHARNRTEAIANARRMGMLPAD